jgi:hypothetical protein
MNVLIVSRFDYIVAKVACCKVLKLWLSTGYFIEIQKRFIITSTIAALVGKRFILARKVFKNRLIKIVHASYCFSFSLDKVID